MEPGGDAERGGAAASAAAPGHSHGGCSGIRAQTVSAPEGERLNVWRHQVREAQRSRCTPEMLQQVRRRAEIQKKAKEAVSRAGHLSRCSEMAQRAWCSGERGGNDDEDDGERGGRYVAARTHLSRIQELQAEAHADEGARNAAIDAIEAEIRQQDVRSGGHVAPTLEEDVHQLLQKLVREPDNDAEVAEKFQLYEKYAETVQHLREEIMKFWVESKDIFGDGRARAEAQKQIDDIDSTVAMGIVEDRKEWFVYLMLNKAHRNTGSMRKVLEDLKRKLELLGHTDECPVCLDGLEGAEIETLGCCHKVCKVCWELWTEMQAGRPFCPLCRHQEFVDTMVGE
eukprot:TRINITY_DN20597_c0_g1_i4.p1 TRINITY_DN20597_c0_g1~~TRINITY_DN20597_c0_g1_i4.p1  ORF type:complete len:341 (+),score=143.84 TRINITY_DN20597_c0_g1_i4:107-1129(+)